MDIELQDKAFLCLVTLYRSDKDGLFYVLNKIKKVIQEEEARHLADAVIFRVKNAKPKA